MSAIEWKGVDEAGFRCGFYAERSSVYRVRIAIPELIKPRKWPSYKVFVQGKVVGEKADLNSAMNFAEAFFERGLHRSLKPPSWN